MTSSALFFRPGNNDHKLMAALVAEDVVRPMRIVFDASADGRQTELREALNSTPHGFSVLDSRVMEMAFVGARTKRMEALPWASGASVQRLRDYAGTYGRNKASLIARFAAQRGYRAVLAPTHFVEGVDDMWLDIDCENALRLREELRRFGSEATQVYYPLAATSRFFRNADSRNLVIDRLQRSGVTEVWLRQHPFGSTCGPDSLRAFIEAARHFQSAGLRVVAERSGSAGLAAFAFDGVSGVESGITLGERFDIAHWKKPRNEGAAFSRAPRVYLARVGLLVSREEAKEILGSGPMRAELACTDPQCCRRGAQDMIDNPRRHYVLSRVAEFQALANAPQSLRASMYMERSLRPATDLMIRLARKFPQFEKHQLRLDSWRLVLGKLLDDGRRNVERTRPALRVVRTERSG